VLIIPLPFAHLSIKNDQSQHLTAGFGRLV